jgi:hypothetical protein
MKELWSPVAAGLYSEIWKFEIYSLMHNNYVSSCSDWSKEGISSKLLPSGDVQVLSTHLTSFTVLVSVNGEQFTSEAEERALNIITYIGCAISIMSLLLTITILLIFRYAHVSCYHC